LTQAIRTLVCRLSTERANIHVHRMARTMPFSGGLPKNQSRRKRFDKAPRFTLKGRVFSFDSQSANSNRKSQ
jgi:hypothetical protein